MFDGQAVTHPEETGMSIITSTNGTWIAASWNPGDDRTVYIEGDYRAVVTREDNGEYGIAYRATVTVDLGSEELEVAEDLLEDGDDARDWAELWIENARA